MMVRVLSLGLLIFLSIGVSKAQWTKLVSVERESFDFAAQDNIGNFYVLDSHGNLSKYDIGGQFIAEYSPAVAARSYEIDAVSQLKVLLFYQDLQEFILLDRFLTTPARYRLEDLGLGYISAMTINYQQNVWVVDMSDFMLKLVDPGRNSVIEQKSLARIMEQESPDIRDLTTYQNNMYLIDRSLGVFVFDNIGNYVTTISMPDSKSVGFFADYVYHTVDQTLYIQGIYGDKQLQLELPSSEFLDVLYNGERLVVFREKGFDIYKYLSRDLGEE